MTNLQRSLSLHASTYLVTVLGEGRRLSPDDMQPLVNDLPETPLGCQSRTRTASIMFYPRCLRANVPNADPMCSCSCPCPYRAESFSSHGWEREGEGWMDQGTGCREVGGQEPISGSWCEAIPYMNQSSKPGYMLHCLIGFHLQNTSSKIKF